MKIFVDETSKLSGARAAEMAAEEISKAIAERGACRLLLSTGASQFDVLECLVQKDLEWDKVTMFHLDEYVGMPITHIASFRKYLTERFVDKVHPGSYFFVDGEGDVEKSIAELTAEVRKAPIDVALVGIGENGHIAFNDPPADFESREAFFVVNLDERCKKQQMGEGWFATLDDVPNQAISMTPYQIASCRVILSIVPGERKANAVAHTLEAEATTPLVPATLLREHENWTLFLDKGSAKDVRPELLK